MNVFIPEYCSHNKTGEQTIMAISSRNTLLAALAFIAFQAQAVNVTVAYQTSAEPAKVAQADNTFAKESGATVDWRKFDSGASIVRALASGDVPVGSVWEGDYRLPVVLKNDTRQGQRSLSDIGDTYISSPVPSVSVPLRQIADVEPVWSQSKIVHRNGMRCITVTADLKRGANAMRMTSRISDIIDRELVLPAGVTTELGGAHEFDWETIPPIASGLSISLVIIFFFILVNFRKFGITLVVMASMSLCLFGAVVGLRIADFTIGLTSVLGFITLLGMIVRNVILMYQHAEDKRKVCHWSARLAAYDAGKRRMVPIFLTTATTAVGVVPMMFGGSTFWAPVGVTIFAGGIGSLILVVTILPVLYSKIYK